MADQIVTAGGHGVLSLALMAAGIVLVLYAYVTFKRYWLVASEPTTEVMSISKPGLVELSGRVEPAEDAGGEPFTAPVSGDEDCVLAGWEVKEWDDIGKHEGWNLLSTGFDTTPFYLDDGTGRALVHLHDDETNPSQAGWFGGIFSSDWVNRLTQYGIMLENVQLDFESEPEEQTVKAGAEEPDSIRQFVAETPIVERQPEPSVPPEEVDRQEGDRHYSEHTIRIGDEVYLLGYARHRDRTRADDDHLRVDDAVITRPPKGPALWRLLLGARDAGLFLLSNRTEEDVATEAGARMKVALVLGLILFLAGLHIYLQAV